LEKKLKIRKLHLGCLVKIENIEKISCIKLDHLKDIYCSNFIKKTKTAYIVAHTKDSLNCFLSSNGLKKI